MLACLSGFIVLLDNDWSFLLKTCLIVHPIFSVIAAFGIPLMVLHQTYAPNRSRARMKLLFLPAILFVVFCIFLYLRADSGNSVYAWIFSIGVFLSGIYGLWGRECKPSPPRSEFEKLCFYSGGLLWSSWLVLTYTGIMALLLFQNHNIIPIMTIHRYASFIFTAFLFIHLFTVIRLMRPENGKDRRPQSAIRYGVGIAVLLAFIYGVYLAWPERSSWTVPLSTTPLEKRAAGEKQWLPTSSVSEDDLALLDITNSCGRNPGCHGELVDEHIRSIHNISIQPDYFQVNIADMSKEVGEDNQVICAGCHFPTGALDRRKDAEYYKTRNNFSCVFCHSMVGGGVNPNDKRRSWYRVAPPWSHLRMFPADDSNVSPSDHFFIRINAMGHRRAFKKAFHSKDDFCNACHHLQMAPLETPGLNNPKCILCHMQPQTLFGGMTEKKSHLFVGANVGPATLTGDKETAGIIRKWAAGEIVPNLMGWESVWNVRDYYEDPITNVPWILLTFYYDEPPVPGDEFNLYIISTNTGLGHHFPSGSLDLVKAWLQVEAKTEEGRTFFESGLPRSDGSFSPDTVKLGGYIIGEDGKIVTRNRVWQVRKKVVERRIPNKKEITDTIRIPIPENIGKMFRVTAQWKYIKLDQDFLDYAYGKGNVEIPPVLVGKGGCSIPVTSPTEGYTTRR